MGVPLSTPLVAGTQCDSLKHCRYTVCFIAGTQCASCASLLVHSVLH